MTSWIESTANDGSDYFRNGQRLRKQDRLRPRCWNDLLGLQVTSTAYDFLDPSLMTNLLILFKIMCIRAGSWAPYIGHNPHLFGPRWRGLETVKYVSSFLKSNSGMRTTSNSSSIGRALKFSAPLWPCLGWEGGVHPEEAFPLTFVSEQHLVGMYVCHTAWVGVARGRRSITVTGIQTVRAIRQWMLFIDRVFSNVAPTVGVCYGYVHCRPE